MPRYNAVRQVYVLLSAGASAYYGFNTKADAADSTTLGHVELIAGQNDKPVLFGINSVKPGRASKVKASGATEASFISYNAVTAAKTAGWSITSGRNSIYRETPRTDLVKAKLSAGCFLGWRMPKETYTRISAQLAANGILDVATGDSGVFYGVNRVAMPNGDVLSRKSLRGSIPYGADGKSARTYLAYDKTP